MSYSSIAFLACSIPDLDLDPRLFKSYCLGGKLHSDRGLGFVGELVLLEAREEVGLSDSGV